MLCLSQTTGYAIAVLAHLNGPEGEPRQLRTLARLAGVPYAYLAKRMPGLVAAGLVSSVRGQGGGILLARPAAAITLLEISEAVESRQWLGRCLLGLTSCSDERACPAHEFWKGARQQIELTLRSTTLADVIAHEQRMGRRREAR